MPEVRTLNDYERGWVSGLVDGEGSISVVWGKGKRKLRPHISPCIRMTLTNSCRPLLEEAQKVLGVGTIHEKKSKRRTTSNRKQCWTYQNADQTTLTQVLPQLRLIVKEEIKSLAIELIRAKAPYRWNGTGMDIETRNKIIGLAQEICRLNSGKEVNIQ